MVVERRSTRAGGFAQRGIRTCFLCINYLFCLFPTKQTVRLEKRPLFTELPRYFYMEISGIICWGVIGKKTPRNWWRDNGNNWFGVSLITRLDVLCVFWWGYLLSLLGILDCYCYFMHIDLVYFSSKNHFVQVLYFFCRCILKL